MSPALALLTWLLLQGSAPALAEDDWAGFRGSDGQARTDDADLPVEWSETANLAWRTELPGPGSSSPIAVGDRVYLTCWSGYGLDRGAPGDPAELRRHVVALDREEGTVLWSAEVDPAAAEDPFEGRLATHGYSSSTLACDGERLYAFFGKRGVLAFDLEGQRLWEAEVGLGSSEWNTGSAASPVLCGDLVVVLASDESQSLRAFDRKTGKEAWKLEDPALHLAFDTPVLAGDVLAVALLEAIWGLDPRTGHKVWTARTRSNGALAPCMVWEDDVLYSLAGQSGTKGYALRLGGEGDVTDSHILWSSRYGSYVTSPVLVGDHLYWVDESGLAYCADKTSGELVYRERLGAPFYASIVAAGDLLLCVSRDSGTFVLPASPDFEILAQNRFESDDSTFDASPAVSLGQLFLRSWRYCYCVEDGAGS